MPVRFNSEERNRNLGAIKGLLCLTVDLVVSWTKYLLRAIKKKKNIQKRTENLLCLFESTKEVKENSEL